MTPRVQRIASAAIACAALAVAAFLRLDGLGVPSYWLDEILHQQLTTEYMALPWWRWLGRLHEEHAAVYYLTQAATRLFGTSEWAGRLAAATFGIATVPLAWMAARRVSPIACACAAILFAVSPLHVYFSREARSYALLALLTALLVIVLQRGRSLGAAAAVLLAMLYTSGVSATVVLSALIVSAACAIALPESRRWYTTVAAFCLVTLALFRVVYASRPVADANWPGFPAVDAHFVASLMRTFSVSAWGTAVAGRTAVAMLVFAIIGIVALFRKDRRDAIVLTGMAVLPVAISLAVLKTLDHFYAPRYVMPAVFGYCVLAAIGIAWVATLVRVPLLATVIAAITAVQMWGSARAEPFHKLDWRAVAAVIAAHARPGDVVLAAEGWSDVSLRYYLDRIPNAPGVLTMVYPSIADRLRRTYPGTWFVTAGYDDLEMRRWLCGFPMIAASPLENFRLHYASPHSDFLRERGGAGEFRAGARMHELTFVDGWASPEADFRWAVGKRAKVTFASWGARERVLRMRVLPSASGQSVRISVNGKTVTTLTLPDQWSEQRIPLPAVDGINTFAFDFALTHVPGGHDQRPLAAAFADVLLDEKPAQTFVTRSAAGLLIDRNTGWRGHRVRVTGPFVREEMLSLMARLGFDPETVWPALNRGELHIEDLAETLAYGQDCTDDETFLRLAFGVILERGVYENERTDLLARIAAGESRPEIVRRIVRSDDFARRYIQVYLSRVDDEGPSPVPRQKVLRPLRGSG